jgi:PAS domain S-box-containing protein
MAEKPTYDELKQRVQELETDKTQLEKKLQEANFFSEEIMRYMTEGLVLTDIRETVIFINQRLSEMLGYLPEQIIGKCWLEMVSAEQQTIAKEALARRAQKHIDRYEIILRHKDGHKFPVLIGAGPRFDKQTGKYIGTMGVVTDISDRKQAEDALNRKHTMLARTEAVAHVGSWEWEVEGDKVTWSEELFRIFGLDPMEQAPPFKEHQAFYVPEDRGRLVEAVEECLRNSVPYDLEVTITPTGGQLRHCVVRGIPEYGDDGAVNRLYGSLHDITERKRMEVVLREREEKYRLIFNMGVNAMFLVDNNTTQILECNNKASQLFGYSSQELLSLKMTDLSTTPEQTRRACRENVLKQERVYQTKNGELISVDITSGHFYLANKAVHISAIRDITEKKHAQEALQKSEERLKLALDSVSDALWDWRLDTGEVYFSSRWYTMLGYKPYELPQVFETWRKLLHPDDLPGAEAELFQHLEMAESFDIEFRMRTKDNHWRWILARGKTVEKDDQGKAVRMLGTHMDITDRKQAEKQLKLAHERTLSILDSIDSTVYVADLDTCEILFMNKKMITDFGGDRTGEICYRAFRKKSEPCEFCTNDQLVNKLGNPAGVRIWNDKNPITRRHYINYDRAIEWTDGRLVRMQVATDITDLKKMEAQLIQAQKMESVGRLAGGVAHDFNNMLGVILGHTEMALLQADETHDLYTDLKEIQKAATRSADITKQLLAFARKQTISPRKLDLNNTVESMLNMLRRLIGENIDLVWQPEFCLWPIKMDPSQIDQILANLCVNARDAFSGVGKLTIETGKKTFDQEYCNDHSGFIPGDFVLLGVSDNGCGMDKGTLNNLFEPFFTTKDVGKGTGLGLATVYGIVKQNNGFITVYSEPGQGSTFNIYLPRLFEDKKVDKAMPRKKTAAGGTETILLVEDEPSILKVTAMMLERKGYSVLPAAAPAEAIELAKTHVDKIHLLMTDVVMPEMNGKDLAEKLKTRYPDILLLFMSGYTSDVITHQGMLDDGVTFIQKPFSMEDLTGKVREILDTCSDKTQV